MEIVHAIYSIIPNLEIAATSWIYVGGSHHTAFSMALTSEHIEDFSEMAGLEYLQIDEKTTISGIKKELRFKEVYYSN